MTFLISGEILPVFFSTLPGAKKMVQLHAKPGKTKKKHDIPGEKTFEASTSQP